MTQERDKGTLTTADLIELVRSATIIGGRTSRRERKENVKPIEKKPKKPEDHSLEDEYYPSGAPDRQEHKTGLILKDGKQEGTYTLHYRKRDGTIKDSKQPFQIDGTDWMLLNLFKAQSSFRPGEFDKAQKDKIRRLGEKLRLLGYEIAITEEVGEDIFKLRPIPINKTNEASSEGKTEAKQQTANNSS